MIYSRNDTLRYAGSFEAPKHSESELRDYLVNNGADYYGASSAARETTRNIESADWNDGGYWDDRE